MPEPIRRFRLHYPDEYGVLEYDIHSSAIYEDPHDRGVIVEDHVRKEKRLYPWTSIFCCYYALGALLERMVYPKA